MRLDELKWHDIVGMRRALLSVGAKRQVRVYNKIDTNTYWVILSAEGTSTFIEEKYPHIDPLMAQCVLNDILARYPAK